MVLVARRAEKLEELATELRAAGGRAHVLGADLSDRSARATLLDRVGELGLTLDILVNNAGLSTLGPVAASDPDAEMNMIEVDVMAVADLCSRALPGMVQRRRGAVLNVASTAAFQPLPGQAAYAAGKAFVLSYTESLTGELKALASPRPPSAPGPWTPVSVRQPASRRKTPKPHCPASCGKAQNPWPGPESTASTRGT